MTCDICGKPLQRLFTSVYCPACEKNKGFKTNEWISLGEVTQISRNDNYSYRFTFKPRIQDVSPTLYIDVKYDSIVGHRDTCIEAFICKVQVDKGWYLYQRDRDHMFYFTCYPHTLDEV